MTSNEEPLRIGLIGAGGNMKLRHIPGFRETGEAELVAVCNRSEASSRAVADEYGIARGEPDPAALRAARVQDVHVGGMDGDRRYPARREDSPAVDPVGSERAPAGVGQGHRQNPARRHGPLRAERVLEKGREVALRTGIASDPFVFHPRQDQLVLLGDRRPGRGGGGKRHQRQRQMRCYVPQ